MNQDFNSKFFTLPAPPGLAAIVEQETQLIQLKAVTNWSDEKILSMREETGLSVYGLTRMVLAGHIPIKQPA